MKIPHPIPYQGSKRNISKFILPFIPSEIDTLIEPFAGSAAVSIAAACHGRASNFHLNDINKPLMNLWRMIIHDPKGIVDGYEYLWKKQRGKEKEFYNHVRDEFNTTHRPDYLLYLLARCVKASVRYNSNGHFNQSPDNRRLGRAPEQMRNDIFAVSNLFHGRVKVTDKHYEKALKIATQRDLVYLDPPYQGVCNNGDPRYYTSIEFEEFMQALDCLNRRSIPFILSYDGRTGGKSFGKELPDKLELFRIEIEAGRSTQSTLLGRKDLTYESIYLSPTLGERLENHRELANRYITRRAFQLSLPGH